MFSGSLRLNLDPTGRSKDSEIISLLEKAGLESILSRKSEKKKDTKKKKSKSKDTVDKPQSGLYFHIEENGKNLSSGEKQLICICRAILR